MARGTKKYDSDNSSEKSDLFSDSESEVEAEVVKPKAKPRRDTRSEYMTLKTKKKKKSSQTQRSKSAYLSVNKRFQEAFKDTSSGGDAEAFKYLLKKTPIPVVLHHLHFLFSINRDHPTNTALLMAYNDKFNIVSRYFLKAMKTKERASLASESLSEVTKKISKRVDLKEIDNLLHFTPEFILMTTIQSGNMVSHDQIASEWELMEGFKRSCDLIAAFFGVSKYFSDPSRFVSRQALFIACICGGSVDTLKKIVKSTDASWLSDYTMRKTREMCTPPEAMLEFLREEYSLKM